MSPLGGTLDQNYRQLPCWKPAALQTSRSTTALALCLRKRGSAFGRLLPLRSAPEETQS